MKDTFQNLAAHELEDAPEFPNLLEDEDFAYYYWTLPFCTL